MRDTGYRITEIRDPTLLVPSVAFTLFGSMASCGPVLNQGSPARTSYSRLLYFDNGALCGRRSTREPHSILLLPAAVRQMTDF